MSQLVLWAGPHRRRGARAVHAGAAAGTGDRRRLRVRSAADRTAEDQRPAHCRLVARRRAGRARLREAGARRSGHAHHQRTRDAIAFAIWCRSTRSTRSRPSPRAAKQNFFFPERSDASTHSRGPSVPCDPETRPQARRHLQHLRARLHQPAGPAARGLRRLAGRRARSRRASVASSSRSGSRRSKSARGRRRT